MKWVTTEQKLENAFSLIENLQNAVWKLTDEITLLKARLDKNNAPQWVRLNTNITPQKVLSKWWYILWRPSIHWMTWTPLYTEWLNMNMTKRYNEKKEYWKIKYTICAAWEKFINFYHDMADTYTPWAKLKLKERETVYSPSTTFWKTNP